MSMLFQMVGALMPQSLTGFLISFICIYAIYRWFELKHRYRTLPMKPGLPILGHLFHFTGNPLYPDGKKIHERAYENLIQMAKDFSEEGAAGWFLLNKPMAIIFKPSHIEKLLSSTEEIDKGEDYQNLYPWLLNGILLSTGRSWKARRRLISPAFHFSILNDFIPIFVQCASNLRDQLIKEQKENGLVRHLMTPVERTALEVVCRTSIGITLDSIEVGSPGRASLNYSKSLTTVIHGAFERSFNIMWTTDFMFYRSSVGQEFKREINKLTTFMDDVIAERIAQVKQKRESEKSNEEKSSSPNDEESNFYGKGKSKKAFLDLLVETHLDQQQANQPLPPGQLLDLKGIREEVNTFTFAGFDTTSSTLLSVLYLIGLHPQVQQKAYEEVIEVLGSDEDNSTIDSETVSRLKYLDACIKESLRLFTTVPIITRHLRSDFKLDNGIVVPAGTNLSINIVGLHSSETYYEKPNEYHPERFFDSEDKNRSAYAFIPFSAGSRNCIGQRFAMTNLKVSLAVLLKKLRIESLVPLSEMKNRFEIVTKPDRDVPVRVHLRN